MLCVWLCIQTLNAMQLPTLYMYVCFNSTWDIFHFVSVVADIVIVVVLLFSSFFFIFRFIWFHFSLLLSLSFSCSWFRCVHVHVSFLSHLISGKWPCGKCIMKISECFFCSFLCYVCASDLLHIPTILHWSNDIVVFQFASNPQTLRMQHEARVHIKCLKKRSHLSPFWFFHPLSLSLTVREILFAGDVRSTFSISQLY